MTSVYLANVEGDGLSTATALRPAITTTGGWTTLMVDPTARKAIVVAQDDAIPDATKVLSAATPAALRQKARATNPTAAQRTAVANWLTANGYRVPQTADGASWWQVIHHVARQVNAAADLDATGT